VASIKLNSKSKSLENIFGIVEIAHIKLTYMGMECLFSDKMNNNTSYHHFQFSNLDAEATAAAC